MSDCGDSLMVERPYQWGEGGSIPTSPLQLPFLDHVAAHQRKIAEYLRATDPKDKPRSLAGFTVGMITGGEALPIIHKYEWLGTMGRSSKFFVGLFSPQRELYGVACFGAGPGVNITRTIGPALCLERGACVHYAPKNAASFLISHACKLIYRLTKICTFYAYADETAGEYGAVYQASGWAYLGQGLGCSKDRPMRMYVLPPGKEASNPANWKSTRALRQGGRNLSYDQARECGWRLELRAGKHVYATNVSRNRRKWESLLKAKPYPAPRPELKIKRARASEEA
jgi:hypothetical protein